MERKKAIEVIKKNWPDSSFTMLREALETLIPELKESEDERIRNGLIGYFRAGKCENVSSYHGISTNDILAWLEKQGEQKFSDIYNKFIRMRETKPKDISEFLGRLNTVEQEFLWEHIAKIRELDKEEQKPFDYEKAHIQQNDFAHKSALEAIKEETVDNANKVESKFKVGDWIIYDRHISKVKDMDSEGYLVEDTYGDEGVLPKEFAEKHYRLWTIQDAKNGDVLANSNISVFIYAEVLYNKPYAYCGVDEFGVFKDNCRKYDWSNSVDNVHPATKEQRDLLFQKMKEAGCEWDAEKLILLKAIEQKPIQDHASIDPQFYKPQLCQTDEQVSQRMVSAEAKEAMYSKQEWSEEDEGFLNLLLAIFTNEHPNGVFTTDNITVFRGNCVPSNRIITWLKSLKPQNKYVYNPYKAVVESIAEMCKHYDKASHSGLRDFYDNVKIKCKDAKEYDSLYPQNTWKPSDEQIKALETTLYTNMSRNDERYSVLSEFVAELKKQMEK